MISDLPLCKLKSLLNKPEKIKTSSSVYPQNTQRGKIILDAEIFNV